MSIADSNNFASPPGYNGEQDKFKQMEKLNKTFDKIYTKFESDTKGHHYERELILTLFQPIRQFAEENKTFLENNSKNPKVTDFNDSLRDVKDKIISLYFNQ